MTGTKYKGYDITLTEAFKFAVDLEGKKRDYDSMGQARDAIDRYEKDKDRVGRKKLSIPLVTNSLETTTLTGVHASNGNLLTTPKVESYYSSKLYVDTPSVRAAIEEIIRLEERRRDIEDDLLRFHVRCGADGTVDGIEKQCKEMLKLAETKPVDLANVPPRKKIRV